MTMNINIQQTSNYHNWYLRAVLPPLQTSQKEAIKKIALTALAFMAIAITTCALTSASIVITLGLYGTVLCISALAFKHILKQNETRLSNLLSVNIPNSLSQPLPRRPEQLLPPEVVFTPLGPQSQDILRRTFELYLDDRQGTPGVHLPGTNLEDRQYVLKRIDWVREKVMPFAHTKASFDNFYNKWLGLILNFEALSSGGGNGIPFDELMEMHTKNCDSMKLRFGKQLQIDVVGAGPIGLTAALTFYTLGFKVHCFEQYEEHTDRNDNQNRGFAERPQPFGLVRQSFWLLSAFISKEKALKAFGLSLDDGKIPEPASHKGDVEIARLFHLFNTTSLMGKARSKYIGPHTNDYVPTTMSLPVQKVQKLLREVFSQIQQVDSESIKFSFGMKCTSVKIDADQRYSLLFNNAMVEMFPQADIIYNATGGKINEMLGFTQKHIENMYGVGAFFQRPTQPANEAPRKQLSRAVRPFCSFDTEEPIYCNMELSKEEFEDKKALEDKIDLLAEDLILAKTRDYFKVAIDLSHSNEVILQSNAPQDKKTFSQLRINGGDAVLKPHFITASGANFGLLGLIGLKYLLNGWLNGKHQLDHVQAEYSELCTNLQKQSYQMVVNLFGRPFPDGSRYG